MQRHTGGEGRVVVAMAMALVLVRLCLELGFSTSSSRPRLSGFLRSIMKSQRRMNEGWLGLLSSWVAHRAESRVLCSALMHAQLLVSQLPPRRVAHARHT
jgi:hypothetical protein